ncbi:MAG TPA: gliding motility-associated C-terminal domain-containing protein, partial [Ignavibacteriaceae bacterium]
DTLGTAQSGIDFPQVAPGDSVFFAIGEDSIVLNIAPIQDGIDEGPESITISAFTVTDCGDTVYTKGTIWVDDEPHSTVAATDTTVLCQEDSVALYVHTTHGFPPYTYTWPDGTTGSPVYLPSTVTPPYTGDTSFVVVSTDACGFQYQDTATITLNQTLKIDTVMQHETECGLATGWVSGQGSGFTGTPHYVWTNSNVDSIPGDSINASVWQNLPAGWYYFSIQDDVCKVFDSIQVQQTPPPNASFDANPAQGNSPLNVTFTNTSDPADEYDWNFGNGDSIVVNNLDDQHSTYIDKGTYTVTLIVKKGACTNMASKTVTVNLPVKYDKPNVFSPNGDGINDFFKINAENATDFHIVILNRWGNQVFESDKANFQWNGKKDNDGADCDDGVYFYKFTISGGSTQKQLEYGYVHLFREKSSKK